jgi:tRNA A-37 threonylcarbamoyl transferase component Bud32
MCFLLCRASDRLPFWPMSGASPEELPPDFEFGAYVIRECIGRGGMARIYRAEHGALRRSVALKVLDRWLLEQPTGRERFLREARAAAAIKHPHVVDILDVGVWGERAFIVMELLSGCDLDTYLDEYGTLSNREIASLALPVIAGVMAVHDAGVVHRDLKPSNIFLSKGPEGLIVPKVLDFGVSKVCSTLKDSRPCDTESREIIGTPAYMAPEGLEGVRMLGPAGDQYSIGAVLYESAVGRPPFEGETLLALLKALAVGDIERPSARRPDILPEVERVILRAIARDPNDRFASLREMGRELWPFADDRTKTVWEHCFGNGKPGDGTPAWMGFRMQPRKKSRRKAAWREGSRLVKGWMGKRWTGPLTIAASLLLLLVVGGLLLGSDPSEPVASAVVGTSAVPSETAEASTQHPAHPATPVGASPLATDVAPPPAPARDAASNARHAEARVPDQLTTATAALHGAHAESDARAAPLVKPSRGGAQVAQRITPTRRKPARRSASRDLAVARAQLAALPPRSVNTASNRSDAFDDPFAGSRAEGAPGELDGLFPGASGTIEHGANQAPIPD